MKISIIVPAFNEERLIARSLKEINEARAAFGELRWDSELIVCDNNSTDRTAELARAAGATVVFEPVNQIARARNRGAAAASGDWLIFIDADSYPSRALLAEVAAHIRRGRCLGGGVTVQLDERRAGALAWLGLWNSISRLARWPAGSFIFCETTAFRQLGGFSRELFVAEEVEFGRRLKRLARQTHRAVTILHRHPLVTSTRKLHLYSAREFLDFIARAVWSRGAVFRNRAACGPWYDGRR